jgi:hypothetical protein
MLRLCVLLGALLFLSGCASEADRAQWNEAWRDFNGDNMKMRSDFSIK